MHNVNWWLMALSFVLGLLLTFVFMIRRVKLEVPITAADRGAAGAGGATATKLAGAKPASAPETVRTAAFGEEPYGAGSAKAGAGGSGPAGWTIKGNEQSMLYHTPDSPNYTQTIAEFWFKDEESAVRAGFTHWGKRGNH